MIELRFHSDAGHGWLEVPMEIIKHLNLSKKISSYSYKKKDMAYLEEDSDAGICISAMKEHNYHFYIKNLPQQDPNPIRSYPRFKKGS